MSEKIEKPVGEKNRKSGATSENYQEQYLERPKAFGTEVPTNIIYLICRERSDFVGSCLLYICDHLPVVEIKLSSWFM